MALCPEQLAFLVINQRHRRTLPIQILGHVDADVVVFPFCQRVEQIALPAQQTKGRFIKANAVTHERHHAVGEREDQHHRCGGQQKSDPQRKRQNMTKKSFHLA
ncbi:hypothetical protein D3C80_1422060 [compost metagenome]